MRKYLKKISFVLALVVCVASMSVFVSAKVDIIYDEETHAASPYGVFRGRIEQNTSTYKVTVSTSVDSNTDGAVLSMLISYTYVSSGDDAENYIYSKSSDNATSISKAYSVSSSQLYEGDPTDFSALHVVHGGTSGVSEVMTTSLDTKVPS